MNIEFISGTDYLNKSSIEAASTITWLSDFTMPRVIALRLLALNLLLIDGYMIFQKEKANVHDAASVDWQSR